MYDKQSQKLSANITRCTHYADLHIYDFSIPLAMVHFMNFIVEFLTVMKVVHINLTYACSSVYQS
jgi:hypothetical protein